MHACLCGCARCHDDHDGYVQEEGHADRLLLLNICKYWHFILCWEVLLYRPVIFVCVFIVLSFSYYITCTYTIHMLYMHILFTLTELDINGIGVCLHVI